MPDPRHALGLAAEAATADWLARAGWAVLARRARARGAGEIDVVALDPLRTLVAIEVRARRSSRAGSPEATIDGRRVARLRRSLVTFAAEHAITHAGLRVDLVSAEPVAGQPAIWRLRRLPGVDGSADQPPNRRWRPRIAST
jgi:Holliday junction resolvase-like predicted endonuclease